MVAGPLAFELKGTLCLYLLEVGRLLSHSESSSCSGSAWCLGSTPHTLLFLALAPSMGRGGGSTMATVFLPRGGGGRCVLRLPLFSLFCGQSSGNKLPPNHCQPGGAGRSSRALPVACDPGEVVILLLLPPACLENPIPPRQVTNGFLETFSPKRGKEKNTL